MMQNQSMNKAAPEKTIEHRMIDEPQQFDPKGAEQGLTHAQAQAQSFETRYISALNNQELRSNFRGAMDFLVDKRKSAFPDADELETLRRVGQQIRNRSLAKLPDLLEQLEAKCQENGIQVHWAADDQEANAIIHGIIAARAPMTQASAMQVVKGKSMVTEEIELNHYLEERDIECLESDMGEYIVQLAKETPSHIIMPAIHKNKQQIAKLFDDKIPDVGYTEDVDQLIGTGREVLRQKFFEADIGISGVNFAVAETGTLCLVENEGNGRMSTTVPNTHIAVTGIEKVIGQLADIPPLLSLLTRSATGQHITTYFNMISSPRKAGEKDGPEQVHLVLLDNGRSRIFADQQLQETLRCIRCGACMNHCPVYSRIGGHAYGTTYPGPIGQVVMPQIKGLDKAGELTKACSLNGACGEACPVKIPLPDLIRRLRKEDVAAPDGFASVLGQGAHRRNSEVIIWQLWQWLHQYPGLYRVATTVATKLRFAMPRKLGPWTRVRTAPKPAKQSLHAMLKKRGVQS